MASHLFANLNTPSVPVIGGGLVFLVVLDLTFRYWKFLRSIRYLPGRRELFGVSIVRQFLPTIPGIVISRHQAIDGGHSAYVKYGRDVMSWIEVIPTLRRHIFVADALAIKEISENRTRFTKNLGEYTSLRYFGSNLITTGGGEWRRQRKIVAPSFNEKNNRLVWNEVVRLGLEIFDVWGQSSAIACVNDVVSELTMPLALAVISSAGFGQPTSWAGTSTESEIPRGHAMAFKDALHVASMNIIPVTIFPGWIIKLSKKLSEGKKAAKELRMYLREMIEEHKNSIDITERDDLFGAMLTVNMNPEESLDEQLSEQELLGNVFAFIVAGHETAGHTMSFILGLLAIEQEEQEKLYKHILSVSPGQSVPTYESFGQLLYAQAVINESLRLYPSVTEIPKVANEDTLLPIVVGPDEKVEHIFVPAEVEIRLDTVGLHYNPRYWSDPYTFNPSRFLGEYNHDAFIPFSTGSRACIGKRFAETEMLAFLVLFIKFYRVELRDKASYEGLSKLEQRRKLFPTLQLITTTPKNPVPLVFVKRTVKS